MMMIIIILIETGLLISVVVWHWDADH